MYNNMKFIKQINNGYIELLQGITSEILFDILNYLNKITYKFLNLDDYMKFIFENNLIEIFDIFKFIFKLKTPKFIVLDLLNYNSTTLSSLNLDDYLESFIFDEKDLNLNISSQLNNNNNNNNFSSSSLKNNNITNNNFIQAPDPEARNEIQNLKNINKNEDFLLKNKENEDNLEQLQENTDNLISNIEKIKKFILINMQQEQNIIFDNYKKYKQLNISPSQSEVNITDMFFYTYLWNPSLMQIFKLLKNKEFFMRRKDIFSESIIDFLTNYIEHIDYNFFNIFQEKYLNLNKKD